MDKYVHALIATYQLVDDYASAQAAIETWASDSGDRSFQLAVALVYLNLGELEKAAEIINRYGDAEGNDVDTCRYLLAQERQDYKQCLEIIERLLANPEALPRTQIINYGKKARILERLGQLDQAREVTNKLVAEFGTEELAVAEAILIYVLLSQESKADELLKTGILTSDTLSRIHRENAEIYASKQRWLLAATELSNVDELDSDEEGLIRLIHFQLNAKLVHAAGRNARKLRLLRGEIYDDGMTVHELRDYERRGEWGSALELLQLLHNKYPGDPRFIAHQAWIYHKRLHDMERAIALLKDVDISKLEDEDKIVLRRNGLIPPEQVN